MIRAILPTSHAFPRHLTKEPSNFIDVFSKMGVWELCSLYPCARDSGSCLASKKFSRACIYAFFTPKLPKEEKRVRKWELETLVSLGTSGKMGGCHD